MIVLKAWVCVWIIIDGLVVSAGFCRELVSADLFEKQEGLPFCVQESWFCFARDLFFVICGLKGLLRELFYFFQASGR